MSFWKEKNVFITGATGFIGSWVAKALVDQGANVIVLERDYIPHNGVEALGLYDRVTLVRGDILDYPLLQRVLNNYDVDTVFHLAAQAIVTKANRSPTPTFDVNIRGTWNLLEACRNTTTIKRIIVASSDKAYGVQKDLPYKETNPLLGRFPYDASKACADILSQCYFITYGLPIVITRNANTYGPCDINFNRIIPESFKSIIEGKEIIIRSDGTPERDYMYVKDAANAYLLLAENIEKKSLQGQAFNFGIGLPVSVLDVVKKMISVSGKKASYKILGSAAHEIDRQYLDCSKVKKVLDWKPKYDLDQGLKETFEWYDEFFKKKKN